MSTPSCTTVAVVLPKPEWAQKVMEQLDGHVEEHISLLGKIDSIKVRKSLNKDEDNFIQAVVNHCLSKIDRKLQSHLTEQTESTKTILAQLREMVSLGMSLSESEKEAINGDLVIESAIYEFPFYVFESDLAGLEELKKLSKISSAGAKSISDIATKKKGEYIIRIAARVTEEFNHALDTYLSQSKLVMKKTNGPTEYLGQLAKFREKKGFFKSSKASEGDYWFYNDGRSKEAYNEDIAAQQYTYNKNDSSGLRQATIKFSVVIHVQPFKHPNIESLISAIPCPTVATGSNAKGKGKL